MKNTIESTDHGAFGMEAQCPRGSSQVANTILLTTHTLVSSTQFAGQAPQVASSDAETLALHSSFPVCQNSKQAGKPALKSGEGHASSDQGFQPQAVQYCCCHTCVRVQLG